MANEEKVIIIPEQLVKARKSLGMQPGEAADNIGVSAEEIHKWEKGYSEPQLEHLWALAELYQRNTDYFLRVAPALPEQLSFRLERQKIINDLPEEVRKIIVRFDELCRAEAELEDVLHERRKIKIEKVTDSISAQKLANRERTRLNLGIQPIRDLRKLLINQGVRIFTLPIPAIPANELSGLSWWQDNYGPCILLNGKNVFGRRQFTLAHEYAHLLLGEPPTICGFMLDIPEERYANQFAVNFLMPAEDVEGIYYEMMGRSGLVPDVKNLGKLASRYGVSLEAIGWRLESLELIPKGSMKERIEEWQKSPQHLRSPRGPRWRHQLGKEFIDLAVKAYSKEQISLSKLARYLGQDLRTVREVASEYKHDGNK